MLINDRDGLPYLDRDVCPTPLGVSIALTATEAFAAARSLGVDPLRLQLGQEVCGNGFTVCGTLTGGYVCTAPDKSGLRRGLAAVVKGSALP